MFDIRKHFPKTGLVLLSVFLIYALSITGLYVPHCHEDGDSQSHHEDCPVCQFQATSVCITPDIVAPAIQPETIDFCLIVPEEIFVESLVGSYQSRSPPYSLFIGAVSYQL